MSRYLTFVIFSALNVIFCSFSRVEASPDQTATDLLQQVLVDSISVAEGVILLTTKAKGAKVLVTIDDSSHSTVVDPGSIIKIPGGFSIVELTARDYSLKIARDISNPSHYLVTTTTSMESVGGELTIRNAAFEVVGQTVQNLGGYSEAVPHPSNTGNWDRFKVRILSYLSESIWIVVMTLVVVIVVLVIYFRQKQLK